LFVVSVWAICHRS